MHHGSEGAFLLGLRLGISADMNNYSTLNEAFPEPFRDLAISRMKVDSFHAFALVASCFVIDNSLKTWYV